MCKGMCCLWSCQESLGGICLRISAATPGKPTRCAHTHTYTHIHAHTQTCHTSSSFVSSVCSVRFCSPFPSPEEYRIFSFSPVWEFSNDCLGVSFLLVWWQCKRLAAHTVFDTVTFPVLAELQVPALNVVNILEIDFSLRDGLISSQVLGRLACQPQCSGVFLDFRASHSPVCQATGESH